MNKSIENLRSNVIDTSLLVSAIMGGMAFIISLTRLLSNALTATYLLELLVVVSLGIIAIFRKKISNKFKAGALLFLILFFSLYDAFYYGFFSSARVYLILIPFFSLLYFRFIRVVVFYIFAIAGFIAIGLLHHKGIIEMPSQYQPQEYVLKIYPWIINAIHITIVALIILVILWKYLNTYSDVLQKIEDYKDRLEVLVDERTQELETTNEELKSANDELYSQREELENTLDSLKKTQDQLIQSEKMASLGVFSAGIAHEVNNPLNFISGGLQGIQSIIDDFIQKRSKLNEEEKEVLLKEMLSLIEHSKNGVSRAAKIVDSLKSYSYSGNEVIFSVNIHEIIDSTLLILKSEIPENIEIIKNYNAVPEIKCLKDKIHQVVLNILDNAIFAIKSKKQIDNEKIIITTSSKEFKKKTHLFIHFENTGPKIPEDVIGKIFDPFFTTKDPGEGTGLGLSISYNIIKEHNGDFTVKNSNEVVDFCVRLPLFFNG